jgi:hypothetical protein
VYGRWYVPPDRWRLQPLPHRPRPRSPTKALAAKQRNLRSNLLPASAPPPRDPAEEAAEEAQRTEEGRLRSTMAALDGPFLFRSFLRKESRDKPFPHFISALPAHKTRRRIDVSSLHAHRRAVPLPGSPERPLPTGSAPAKQH